MSKKFKFKATDEWYRAAANAEGDHEISAGGVAQMSKVLTREQIKNLDDAQCSIDDHGLVGCENLARLIHSHETLRAALDTAMGALEWYADKNHYHLDHQKDANCRHPACVALNEGQKAREANRKVGELLGE